MTMLYRSTDRLCRAGAPVQNLTHSASFHSAEKHAPSNPGTKHLVGPIARLERQQSGAAAKEIVTVNPGSLRTAIVPPICWTSERTSP
jgi:hypothetical protein